MPNALRIGLLGPLQVRDETGRPVHVGGRQLRVLLTLLALDAGRVVPAGSLAGEIWPADLPDNPGNALQTLVSRLRAQLRQAGIDDVIESHPAGYRLAVPPEAVDVMAFETLAARGRRALADGDAGEAARVMRDALLAWRGQPLADAALGTAHSVRGSSTKAASTLPQPGNRCVPGSAPMSSRPPVSTVVPSPRTTRSPSLPARSRIP